MNKKQLIFMLIIILGNRVVLAESPEIVRKTEMISESPLIMEHQFYAGDKQIAKQQWRLDFDINDLRPKLLSEEGQIMDGVVKTFYPDGQLYQRCNYRDNRLDGETITYSPEGMIMSKEFWQEGDLREVKRYKDGILIEEGIFKDAMPVGYKKYDEKGNLIEQK